MAAIVAPTWPGTMGARHHADLAGATANPTVPTCQPAVPPLLRAQTRGQPVTVTLIISTRTARR